MSILDDFTDFLKGVFDRKIELTAQASVPIPENTGQKESIVPERQYRQWRLTYYLVGEQSQFSGPQNTPVMDPNGTVLKLVEPGFFSHMSLQGTGKTRDGKMFNVSGKYVKAKHEDYSGVLDYHKKHLPTRPYGYSGIEVENERVVKALAFTKISDDKIGKGYGMIRGVAHEPFRTLAADIGTAKRSDPRFKDKGGLVPPHTRVHIKELTGLDFPDGTKHDGWCEVIDSGGGIFGAHFDLFVGVQSLKDRVKFPGLVHVWFEGIEGRVDEKYDYGLKDA